MTKGNEARVTNLDYLTELSNGNTKFVEEMINIFLVEIPGEIKNLENSIRKKDYGLVQRISHKLKSTIPFVGLDKVIEGEVYEIEKLAKEHSNISKIEELFSKVKRACRKAVEELGN